MAHYKMSDVVTEVNERENNPANSKYERFVGLEHYVSGEVVIRNYGSTERLESTMKVFQAGDILVARRNVYLKRASTVDFDGLTSGDSIVLRAKDPEIGRILPFVLNTDAFWDFADQYSDGTMSKRLSPKTLMTFEFDLPDGEELSKLADILWAANDTRESYQALLKQADELVKSQFIELIQPFFEEGRTEPMNSLIRPDRPVTYGILKPGTDIPGGIPVVRVKDYPNGVILEEDMLHTTPEIDAKYARSHLIEGDLLLSIGGSIGRMAIVPASLEGANITQHTARLSFGDRVLPLYVRGVIEMPYMQDLIASLVKGVAQKGLNLSDVKVLPIPVPEMEVQNRLVALYEQLDKSKFELNQAIANISELMKSLIQQDFSN